ncbi:hypothetical protein A2210_02685 [Candidatus Woesebacteria bacterium RIFOXYA1_FULL_40_18]|uniref:Glycosyltransferase RgtA/B/C/D-like domain-containing protein n=3 Tax=Candidatus Woeseibacteriota TaxID=1752722 RepID=A0A1F8CNU7_9BACT|nr:MAG: hypothetical protein A2210_02685 [Candidatus Woesebacteria bacterium RIFOXYA1_FULL_40_18]OGM81230.1 MAG: hypothetical protein A2361_02695 [Candidatus Woesebacteria bacterium RIFOXYB1_FULL_40_26]OGM88112.1 MAG: hypothetical protein A2614_00785 [Candidatus Woesebacteria bacterium RIFOXYD1_FULL_40_21]
MKQILAKIHTPNWLCFLLLAVLILRIPSFFEPYSYGDEMIYLTMGEAVRQGIPLYKAVHDNKPPLLYLTAALGGNLFWFKATLAFWNLATIILFWKLVTSLFPNKDKLHKIATAIFALASTLPLLEGNIANAEMFMIGPTILAFFILLSKNLNFKNIFFSGVLFSIASLFKIPAAFDVGAIVVFWLIQSEFKKEKLAYVLKNTLYLTLGFLVPIGLSFLWFWTHGALGQYLTAAFLQNIGYLSSFRPQDIQKPFFVRNAPLLIRALVVFAGSLILYLKRKKLSASFIFIVLWLLFSLFGVTLSERPYPHYLLQSLGPISMLFAILFTSQNLEQVLAIIPLTVAFLVPAYYKFYYYPTASYYLRFVSFATGRIGKEEYFSRFNGAVNRNYEISDFITKSTKKDDKIFVWGDSPPIYALARRFPPIKYTAEYHINDFSSKSETALALTKDKPKMIVILPNTEEFMELNLLLSRNYLLIKKIDGAEIWHLRSL